jgi:hypothetical protein
MFNARNSQLSQRVIRVARKIKQCYAGCVLLTKGIHHTEEFMATPKELVAQIARQTGVPEGTVILHDRNLMNAGLRSEGQRGRGKSVVTFADAANLLIAVAGSRNVKDSAKTVRDYSGLVASQPLVFGDTKRGHSFGDALAAMLEAVPADRGAYAGSDGGTIEVWLYGPRPSARIVWELATTTGRVDYEAPRERLLFADLQFIAKFSQVTLGHVGELVAG